MAKKPKPTHGGKRKGAGRKEGRQPPRVYDAKLAKAYSVRLREDQAAWARLVGVGALSAGIRELIEASIRGAHVR